MLIEMRQSLISITETPTIIYAAQNQAQNSFAPHLYLVKATATNAAKAKHPYSRAPHLYLANVFI